MDASRDHLHTIAASSLAMSGPNVHIGPISWLVQPPQGANTHLQHTARGGARYSLSGCTKSNLVAHETSATLAQMEQQIIWGERSGAGTGTNAGDGPPSKRSRPACKGAHDESLHLLCHSLVRPIRKCNASDLCPLLTSSNHSSLRLYQKHGRCYSSTIASSPTNCNCPCRSDSSAGAFL